MSTTEKLVRLVSKAEFRALPPEVLDVAKVVILDGPGGGRGGVGGKLVGLLGTGLPPSSP